MLRLREIPRNSGGEVYSVFRTGQTQFRDIVRPIIWGEAWDRAIRWQDLVPWSERRQERRPRLNAAALHRNRWPSARPRGLPPAASGHGTRPTPPGNDCRRFGNPSRTFGEVSRTFCNPSRSFCKVSRTFCTPSRFFGKVSRSFCTLCRTFCARSRSFCNLSRSFCTLPRTQKPIGECQVTLRY